MMDIIPSETEQEEQEERRKSDELPRKIDKNFKQKCSLKEKSMAEFPSPSEMPMAVNDLIYGSIDIPKPLKQLIDTKPMQRLRRMKQTGIVDHVYPSSNHTRFDHSLGVMHLANEVVSHLRRTQPHLEITAAEHLCVCIAALFHDLGHGPFSHLFDGLFAEKMKKTWKHEDMSIRIANDLLMNNSSVKKALEPYLSTGDIYKRNVTFITELIGSKRFKLDYEQLESEEDIDIKKRAKRSNDLWAMEGRSMSRSFLYDIVSNSITGHDVDKMDYLLRDSKLCGVSIAFDRVSVDRIIKNMQVVVDERTGCRRIGYYPKVCNNLKQIGDSRQELHDKVYQHKAVRGMELLLVDAMEYASEYLEYKGDDGRVYNLANVTENIGAFLQTSDTVIDHIMRLDPSNDVNSLRYKRVKEAQQLLEKIELRDTYNKIHHIELSGEVLESQHNDFNGKKDVLKQAQKSIEQKTHNSYNKKFVVMIRELSRGVENCVHPIQREVLVTDRFDKDQIELPIGTRLNPDYIKNNCNPVVTKCEFFIMGERELNNVQRKEISNALTEVIAERSLIGKKRPHEGVDDNRNIQPVKFSRSTDSK